MVNSNPAPASPESLLRLPQVVALTGRSRVSIYEEMRADRFPRQVKIGRRAVAWKSSEIQAWIAARGQDGAL